MVNSNGSNVTEARIAQYEQIEAAALHILPSQTLQKPTRPCDCGDTFCYGFVRYTGGVRSTGRTLPKHLLTVEPIEYTCEDRCAVVSGGDLVNGDTFDLEVQHISPCVVVGCGRYTLHVRTAAGFSVILDRLPDDPRMWRGGQRGWLYSYSSEDQLGLYQGFVADSRMPLTADSLWFGMHGTLDADVKKLA